MGVMRTTLVSILLLLTSCEDDPPPMPKQAEVPLEGAECATLWVAEGNDWQICNVGGRSYFCAEESGCVPLMCAEVIK